MRDDAAPLALSEERVRTFAAAADRILPGQHGPGAAEAHVVGCLPTLLELPVFAVLRPHFESALDLLQSMARELHQQDFARCSASQRDALLLRLQGIPHPAARRALGALVKATLMGYLGDPVHGGNRAGLGWKSLGLWIERHGGAR